MFDVRASAGDAFQKVNSPTGRFTAEMPGKPKEEIGEIAMAKFKIKTWKFT